MLQKLQGRAGQGGGRGRLSLLDPKFRVFTVHQAPRQGFAADHLRTIWINLSGSFTASNLTVFDVGVIVISSILLCSMCVSE